IWRRTNKTKALGPPRLPPVSLRCNGFSEKPNAIPQTERTHARAAWARSEFGPICGSRQGANPTHRFEAILSPRSVFCDTNLALASSVRQPDEALNADSIKTP